MCILRFLDWEKQPGKVSQFFEGVTAEIENSRREDEVQFQQAYNKTELKKAIKQYPG